MENIEALILKILIMALGSFWLWGTYVANIQRFYELRFLITVWNKPGQD